MNKSLLEDLLELAKRLNTLDILVDIQRAVDELRSEESSGNISDLLLASSRAQAILENILKKYGVQQNASLSQEKK